MRTILLFIFLQIKFIQMNLNIPVGKLFIPRERLSIPFLSLGLIFSGYDRELYTRMNPIARQYIFNKLERRYQYNITELFDSLQLDSTDADIWSKLCAQLSNGIMSIIGHINYDDYDWLAGFSSTYQVPFIGLDNHEYNENRYYMSLMPDILPALVAFIRRYQIKQIVYLYDDTTGARRLQQLMRMQTSHQIKNLNIITRYLGNPDDPYDLLQNIEAMTNPIIRPVTATSSTSKFHGRFIVLDFYLFETYRIIMDKIKHRGMTTADYHYVLMTLNAKQLDMNYFRYGGVNVTFFSLPSFHDMQSKENYINSLGNNLSIESLLIADAWETLLGTINRMLRADNETRESLKVSRKGKFYNGLTPGIDCRHRHIQAWSVGQIYLENLLKTNFQGLTGNVQFSNKTGQRRNYTFEVHRVARNELPKHIGYFREPNTFEVRLFFDNGNDFFFCAHLGR